MTATDMYEPHPFDRPESQPLHLEVAERAIAELRKIAIEGETTFTLILASLCAKAVNVKHDVEAGTVPNYLEVIDLTNWLERRA